MALTSDAVLLSSKRPEVKDQEAGCYVKSFVRNKKTTRLDRRDEIGQLAIAFNAMLAELAAGREREIADQARNAATQAELARVARLTTMGEMAASIAHEINQPLAAVVNNANAGLRWLRDANRRGACGIDAHR